MGVRFAVLRSAVGHQTAIERPFVIAIPANAFSVNEVHSASRSSSSACGSSIGHADQVLVCSGTFATKDHGHAGFAEMVKALDAVVEIRKGESDHMLRLR